MRDAATIVRTRVDRQTGRSEKPGQREMNPRFRGCRSPAHMFAQMFPGMEWIPLMILLTAVGLLVGGIAVIMAVVGGAAGAARKTAAAACIIGVASPTVFLFVLGDSFSGYLCLALPLV